MNNVWNLNTREEIFQMNKQSLEAGVEPATQRLTAACSTSELHETKL